MNIFEENNNFKRETEVELTVYIKCKVSLNDLDAFKDSLPKYAYDIEAIAEFPSNKVVLDI